MALSQKHQGLILVPWFNSHEWKHVKNLIYGNSSTYVEKKQALGILNIWKLRTPKLPSGVEGTLILLEALFADVDVIKNDTVLQSFYGASLMRFINICGAKNDKQGTFYQTAKKNNLPDWLIDIRHDLAHDQQLPSMFMLKLGLNFCLDWLQTEYWEIQEKTLDDIIHTSNYEKVKDAIELYCQINVICYMNSNINCMHDIGLSNKTLQDKITFYNTEVIKPDMKIEDIKNFLLKTVTEAIEPFNKNKIGDIISETLVENKSIFAMKLPQEMKVHEQLPKDFELMWHDIINLLYTQDMLLSFIVRLLKYANHSETEEYLKRVSCMWLTTLFKCLLCVRSNPKKYAQTLFPTDNNDLEPIEVNDIKIRLKNIRDDLKTLVKDVLWNATPYTLYYIKFLLQLTNYSEQQIRDFENSIRLYFLPQPSIIHETVKIDLEKVQLLTNAVEASNSPNIAIIDDTMDQSKRWKRVKDTSIFEGCPLGIMIGQSNDMNPLLIKYFNCSEL